MRWHYHFGLHFETKNQLAGALKKFFRERFGIYMYTEQLHAKEYWSRFEYTAVPTPRKPFPDPNFWHMSLDEMPDRTITRMSTRKKFTDSDVRMILEKHPYVISPESFRTLARRSDTMMAWLDRQSRGFEHG